MNTSTTPNSQQTMPEAATSNNAVPSLDSIAQKMAAMRNHVQATRQTETGTPAEANAGEPVAPTADDAEPEVVQSEQEYIDDAAEEEPALDAVEPTDEVSTPDADTTAQEIIDFVEFAETNPNAKFKFMKNGKEMIIDAKKAAAILGQGGAIHEDARQLKIEKAEFEEYLKDTRAKQEGMLLAMEFTIQPKLRKAYDEIVKTRGYQTTFQQQLAQTQDPAQQARIRASMEQNERYIQQQAALINQLKPNVDQFYQIRQQQVGEVLENSRKAFKDKELRNSAIYDEVREKIAKGWESAKGQLVPGIDNIDLISSDEHLLSLIRDGLKYRDRPKAKSAGSSIAALTTRTGTTKIQNNAKDELSSLQDKARAGDRKAQDNLLVAKLNALRGGRR